jgi:hypothetical protein
MPRTTRSIGSPRRSTGLDPQLDVAADDAAEVGHRQAALEVLELGLRERGQDRVDEDRQRDVGLVRVARVVLDLHHADLHRLVHLSGREAGARGVAHGLDHAVDEGLKAGRPQLLERDGAGLLAQDGVTDLGDLEDGHGVL